jgi:hypothetical protein
MLQTKSSTVSGSHSENISRGNSGNDCTPNAGASIVRGSTIIFVAAFTDSDGNAVEPDSAEVRIRHPLREDEITAVVSVEKSGDQWQGIWNSDVASAGLVSFSILAEKDGLESRFDSHFRLTAGGANPEPE